MKPGSTPRGFSGSPTLTGSDSPTRPAGWRPDSKPARGGSSGTSLSPMVALCLSACSATTPPLRCSERLHQVDTRGNHVEDRDGPVGHSGQVPGGLFIV